MTASKSPQLRCSPSPEAWTPGAQGEKQGQAGWADLHRLLGKQLSEDLSAQRSPLLTNPISPEPQAGGGRVIWLDAVVGDVRPGGRPICLSSVRIVQSNYPEGTTQTSDRQTAKGTGLVLKSCSRKMEVIHLAE